MPENSSQTIRVLGYAQQEAQRLNHEYVGTEHLLLGLIKDMEKYSSQVALQIFNFYTAVPRLVRLEVEKFLDPGPDMITMGRIPYTPRAKKVLRCAEEEAQKMGTPCIEPEHLLLGFMLEEDGIAAHVLGRMGFPGADEVREKIILLLSEKAHNALTQAQVEQYVVVKKNTETDYYEITYGRSFIDTFARRFRAASAKEAQQIAQQILEDEEKRLKAEDAKRGINNPAKVEMVQFIHVDVLYRRV